MDTVAISSKSSSFRHCDLSLSPYLFPLHSEFFHQRHSQQTVGRRGTAVESLVGAEPLAEGSNPALA